AGSASPGGLLSGPAAGANVQAGRNLGNSPSGLLSGPASGVQGPQAGTTSSKNPTGLLSGPAAGVNTNSAVGAAANGPTGLLSGPGAGVQGPQSGTTASTNPTGLLSGPAAGANTNSTVGAAANGPTGLLSGPGAGVQGPQSGTTASKNPTGLLSGPAAGTQGPQSGNTSSKNPTGLLSGPAAGKTSQNGGTGNTGAATANGPTTDQSATTQATGATVDSNGNVIPAIGIVGDGGVAAGETQAFLPDGNGIANSGVPPTNTVTGGFTPGTGRGASQRHGQISNGGVSVQETGKGRTRIMNARDSANHDFDVMQVERQLAVQSLAGSKRLIEQKTGQEIDLAFLRQEMVMQHELLDKLVVYQKYASSDLKEVLVDAERVLITNLADTQRLIEHRLPTARVSARRSGQD
ncbi:MAG: hypothetical protein JWN70_1772, partial [Planctomycetaceae bacterium]|nr:hypothetical protein [Planctomycetaceae bacterium]